MQTPLEVDFQGMPGTPQIQNAIAKHVAQLEQRYGRVTSCRVALKGPGGHHQRSPPHQSRLHASIFKPS